MSGPTLLNKYKQYKFCEKQKELTDEFKVKVILYSFQRCFQKVQNYLKIKQKYRIFPCVTEKCHSCQPPPPQTYNSVTFLVGKMDM